ncbi:hypothetical protein COLO4_19016 [Corchorus olitorius]|uniref:Uncharacterized protein n=1 Tax=Corchorus olitorius TaxID=93759 RepID=A0A1R3J6Z8_9ROSI|nr:hypothetical protein COLO4_19016 [Corchorus olitorius]
MLKMMELQYASLHRDYDKSRNYPISLAREVGQFRSRSLTIALLQPVEKPLTHHKRHLPPLLILILALLISLINNMV